MNERLLPKAESYQAMFYFIENLYLLTNDNGLGDYLSSMQILTDGIPADPAYWSDWEKAVEKALLLSDR